MSNKMSEAGRAWRLLAHAPKEKFEVENRGTFDELVVDSWLHIEQLDTGSWWLRIGDARVVVTVKGVNQVDVDVIRGYYGEERGSTTKHLVNTTSESGHDRK